MRRAFRISRSWLLPAAWLILIPAVTAQTEPAAKSRLDQAARRHYAAAAALQNREQFKLAAEEWAAFLEKFPQDSRAADAQHYLGVCLLKDQDYQSAARAFERAIADHPEAKQAAASHLYLGLAWYNLGLGGDQEALKKAEQSLDTLIAKFPQAKEIPQAYYYLGEAQYAQGNKEAAAKRYDVVVKKYSSDPLATEALYALGVAQEELNDRGAAAKTFAQFLKQSPDHAKSPEVRLRMGELAFAAGRFEDARRFFATASKAEGFGLADQAVLREADALIEIKDLKQAAQVYASFPDRFPNSKHLPAARLAAGKCSFLAGNHDEARRQLAALASEAPAVAAEAAHWTARSYLQEKKPAEAFAAADEALASTGNSPFRVSLELDRADALYELPERRADAVEAFERVARQYPKDPQAANALYMASFAALGVGEYDKALTHARDLVQRFGDSPLVVDARVVAAESLLQLGRHGDAEQSYAALLEGNSKHADVPTWTVRRGMCLYLDRNYEAAVGVLSPLLKKPPSKALTAEAQYLIGSSRLALHQSQQAAQSLAASLTADPKWRQADETWLALADALRQTGETGKALEAIDQLLSSFPKSRHLDRAWYRKAEIAAAAGRPEIAEDAYRKVLADWPESPLAPHAAYGLGWTQVGRGNAQEAVRTLSSLIRDHKSSEVVPKARYVRAVALQQLGDHAKATADVQAYLESEPQGSERSDALYVLALCQTGQSKHAEAAQTLAQLLADDPEYSGADKVWYELGWSRRELNQAAEAAEAFSELARRFPDSPLAAECLFLVGEDQYGREQYAPAATSYQQALAKAGQSELGEKAAHKLAWAWFKKDEFAKARDGFGEQKTRWPQGPLAWDATIMEAECEFQAGRHTEALALFEVLKSSQQPPTASPNMSAMGWLHAAQSAAQVGRWEESLNWLTSAISQAPNNPFAAEMIYEQGWALKNLDRGNEALACFEEVTTRSDLEVAARARFMMGEICFERKQHEEAVKHFFKAAYSYGYPKWQAAALYESGRCFEVLAKRDKAIDVYREVLEKHAASDQAALAKERLDALGELTATKRSRDKS